MFLLFFLMLLINFLEFFELNNVPFIYIYFSKISTGMDNSNNINTHINYFMYYPIII